MIPTLLSQDHLQPSNDFTWLAAGPAIWMQISFNLSVITACIPTMKNIFDSLSGNFSVAIDAPYTLKTIAGKSGMQTTALDKETASSGSHAIVDSGCHNLTGASSNLAECTSNGLRPGAKRRKEEGRSESVENLTGTVLVTDEVNIRLEQHGQPSPSGSQTSWQSLDRGIREAT